MSGENVKEAKTNAITVKSGLTFNVNSVKKNMRAHFESHGLKVTVKEKETGNEVAKIPVFSNSQVATTAAIQKLCELLVRLTLDQTPEDKSGMRLVIRSRINYAIQLNQDLRHYYASRLELFDKTMSYVGQLPLDNTKEISALITKVDKNLKFTEKAQNYLYFLLSKAYHDIINTAYQFLKFAEKKTLKPAAVTAAVSNLFGDTIAHEINCEINRAVKAVGDDVEDTEAEHEDGKVSASKKNDDSDVEADAEEKPKKGAGPKAATPKKEAAATPAKKTTPKKEAAATPSKKQQPAKIEESDDDVLDDEDVQVAKPANTKSKNTQPAANTKSKNSQPAKK